MPLTKESTDSHIGCEEHLAIVDSYSVLGSMHKVAEKYQRSTYSIQRQIRVHNLAIEVRGKCPRCEFVGPEWDWIAKKPVTVTKKRNKR